MGDMVTRTISSVAKICDKWNARVEDLRASTGLILGFNLGGKLCDHMAVDLPRKFRFRYKNSLFVFASQRCSRVKNFFVKVSRVVEKEGIIGGGNNVEELQNSWIFARVMNIGDALEETTICKKIGQKLRYVGYRHSRHVRQIIEIMVVAHKCRY